jgi:hypothetical protein
MRRRYTPVGYQGYQRYQEDHIPAFSDAHGSRDDCNTTIEPFPETFGLPMTDERPRVRPSCPSPQKTAGRQIPLAGTGQTPATVRPAVEQSLKDKFIDQLTNYLLSLKSVK